MQLQFRGLKLSLLLAPLAANLPPRSNRRMRKRLTLEGKLIEQALLQAPQLAARSHSREAAQALTDGAGRLPDQLVVGLDNLPVTPVPTRIRRRGTS